MTFTVRFKTVFSVPLRKEPGDLRTHLRFYGEVNVEKFSETRKIIDAVVRKIGILEILYATIRLHTPES